MPRQALKSLEETSVAAVCEELEGVSVGEREGGKGCLLFPVCAHPSPAIAEPDECWCPGRGRQQWLLLPTEGQPGYFVPTPLLHSLVTESLC